MGWRGIERSIRSKYSQAFRSPIDSISVAACSHWHCHTEVNAGQ